MSCVELEMAGGVLKMEAAAVKLVEGEVEAAVEVRLGNSGLCWG